jgi:hypothetical protein
MVATTPAEADGFHSQKKEHTLVPFLAAPSQARTCKDSTLPEKAQAPMTLREALTLEVTSPHGHK